MRTSPQKIPQSGRAVTVRWTIASQSGSATLSESRKTTTGERASRTPMLRAGPGPLIVSSSKRTSGNRAHTAVGISFDALSTTITSKGGAFFCAISDSGQRSSRSGC
jgi:hypothetical protein